MTHIPIFSLGIVLTTVAFIWRVNRQILQTPARFYAYNADWLPESPVWNLEHEYIHYLDGRFIKYGPWLGTHNTLWWEEGLAEYISKGDNITERIIRLARGYRYSLRLSEVFALDDYQEARVYDRCLLAMRFMFEKHPEEIDSFIGYLRVGGL